MKKNWERVDLIEESKEFHRRMVEEKRFREGTGTGENRKEVVRVI